MNRHNKNSLIAEKFNPEGDLLFSRADIQHAVETEDQKRLEDAAVSAFYKRRNDETLPILSPMVVEDEEEEEKDEDAQAYYKQRQQQQQQNDDVCNEKPYMSNFQVAIPHYDPPAHDPEMGVSGANPIIVYEDYRPPGTAPSPSIWLKERAKGRLRKRKCTRTGIREGEETVA